MPPRSSPSLSHKPLTNRKRPSPSLKKSKQQSITSFFSSTPRLSAPAPRNTAPRNTTPSTLPSQPASTGRDSRPPRTPSVLSPALKCTHTEPPVQSSQLAPDSTAESQGLRRTLFHEEADDEPPLQTSLRKRRRLIREDSDEEDDVPLGNLMSADYIKEEPKKPAKPAAPPAHRDVQMKESPIIGQSNFFNMKASQDPVYPSESQTQSQEVPLDSSLGAAVLSLRRTGDSTSAHDIPVALTDPSVLKHRKAVRQKLTDLSGAVQVGQEHGGWCDKHSWTVKILDAKKRPPTHPDYDKTTLYVPPKELSERKQDSTLTPFQKQFWGIKMNCYDVVVFFKKGKFYEMYDIDADIGNSVLGLNFTKGGRVDMRCCGVPEQSFDKHCARLIDLGYQVGRVEQTETANAAEKRKASSGSSSTLCKRSLVRILTKATVREEGLLRDHRARYVVAVTEGARVNSSHSDSDQSTVIDDDQVDRQKTGTVTIGMCYVDVASGSINISEFKDDFRLARTERLITCLAPHQLVVDMSKCSDRLSNILNWTSRKLGAAVDDLGRNGGLKAMGSNLSTYLKRDSPAADSEVLFTRVRSHLDKYLVSSRAFGGLVTHLKSLKIDAETLSLANYNLFPTDDKGKTLKDENEDEGVPSLPTGSGGLLRMDASALQNLEILTSCLGTESGSLLSFVDRAHTPAGRRLIRKWISAPLVSSVEIEDRLQAVEDLHAMEDSDGGRLLRQVAKQLRTKKDLERALPKLHQFAIVSDGAVMFDDTNKRRVKEFVYVLRSVQDCVNVLESLSEMMEHTSPKSARLKWLCTSGGGVPHDVLDKLNFFLGEAFNLEAAENDGEMIPGEGTVPSFDEARRVLQRVDNALDGELNLWRQRLGDRSIKFYHRGKEPYQLEVKLDTVRGCTPDEFEVASESKTTKRFYTKRVKKLVRERVEANEAFEIESGSVARHMVKQFDTHYSTWSAVAQACAEVDALMGLAHASRDDGSGPMARPKILSNGHEGAVFDAQSLRHPILSRSCSSFVSNSVRLGRGGETDVMILTGPNAGGKSTLARQVGLATVLAQIGCFVPAESLTLRPFEDLFVRMGASDELARGRSTFMVEMEEVGHMLNHATDRSLIIADEVGRGTSTHDGHAIACAAVDQMCRVNKAVTIFSTHYSHLADDVGAMGDMIRVRRSDQDSDRLRVGVYEMAAEVNEKSKEITFLYKLQQGASCHSRGVYCARIAGIEGGVADAAEDASKRLHESMKDKNGVDRVMTLFSGLNMDDKSAMQMMKNRKRASTAYS